MTGFWIQQFNETELGGSSSGGAPETITLSCTLSDWDHGSLRGTLTLPYAPSKIYFASATSAFSSFSFKSPGTLEPGAPAVLFGTTAGYNSYTPSNIMVSLSGAVLTFQGGYNSNRDNVQINISVILYS